MATPVAPMTSTKPGTGAQSIAVTVPPGAVPGTVLTVATPLGATVQAQVPDGFQPGSTLFIQYPAVAAGSIAPPPASAPAIVASGVSKAATGQHAGIASVSAQFDNAVLRLTLSNRQDKAVTSGAACCCCPMPPPCMVCCCQDHVEGHAGKLNNLESIWSSFGGHLVIICTSFGQFFENCLVII